MIKSSRNKIGLKPIEAFQITEENEILIQKLLW